MSWPSHAFDLPVAIPLPDTNIPGNIYLSGIGWTRDLPAKAKEEGFTHVFNCAGWFLRHNHYASDIFTSGINYCEIDMNDVPEQRLDIYVDSVFAKLEEALKQPSKILIHCFYGQSRSVSILCYYLMKKFNWNYDQTIAYIRQYRPVAEPNSGFVTYLKSLKN